MGVADTYCCQWSCYRGGGSWRPDRHATGIGYMSQGFSYGVAATTLSLATNVLATALVAYKSWQVTFTVYRAMLRKTEYIEVGIRVSMLEKVMVLLVESGIVFPALSKFARLCDLEIVDSLFASFEDLKKVVVAFPSLSSLSLFRVVCRKSVHAAQFSSASPSASIWPATLSKLSLSTYTTDSRTAAADVLLWLYAAPRRNRFKELSVDLCNLAAALPLISDTSLTALGIHMHDASEILGDDVQIAQLRPLFSKVGSSELLRLRTIVNLWDDVARLLVLFAAVRSVHRLRLCFESESYLSHEHDATPADFDDTSPEQLEMVLLDVSSPSTFRTLRAVDLACYFDNADPETLREQRERLSVWAARALVQLHERCAVEVYERCAVEVYAYKLIFCFCCNCEWVCGPTGLSKHMGGADFPDACSETWA
ncbi:hypothetical protein V8D89_009350 [Ganoderma adspersum]